MDEQTLGLCPFCGKSDVFVQAGKLDGYSFVWCSRCLTHGPEKQTEAEALAAWNHRAAHSVMAGKVAELEAALERCVVVVLEQRCERGTPWDLACTTIAEKVREHVNAALAPHPKPENRQ